MDELNLTLVHSLVLVCVECRLESDESARRWRLYSAEDPDDPDAEPMLAVYCPDCANREFGVLKREQGPQTRAA